jgi:branched-chain amino acid aminotransferase
MPLASIDGAVMDAQDARIPVTDDGLLRGDGVFEVVRLYAGRPFALQEHLTRMTSSARNLRLPFDPAALRADVSRLLAAAPAGDSVLRLVVTRGGRRIALVEEPRATPDTIALATVPYAPTRVLDGIKSLSYAANMLATRLAQERGGDEALLVTPHGRVLEAPTSSFFCVLDGVLCTPPLEDHILDSITRRLILEETPVTERPMTLDDVARASEAFIASTVRQVVAVHAVDGIRLAAPGPVGREVDGLVRARIERGLSTQAF